MWVNDFRWLNMKSELQEGDEIWEYKAGNLWSTLTGTKGYAHVRHGEVLFFFPTGQM
jgi:hypothetical protein